MNNAIARQASPEEAPPAGVQETVLRLALEEARQIAAQSRLLALNAAFESAGAGLDAEATGEMEALGGSAVQAAHAAESLAAAVELLLQQVTSAGTPANSTKSL